MARVAPVQIEEFHPIADINTTPLIDLMLVLLVMFIIIIPVNTHKMDVDLPQNAPSMPSPSHNLDIDAEGRLYWDGQRLAANQLDARLRAMVASPAQPVLHMNADAETRYERFDEILAVVRRAGITRMGFVDMRRFSETF